MANINEFVTEKDATVEIEKKTGKRGRPRKEATLEIPTEKVTSQPSYDDLLGMISTLSQELAALKNEHTTSVSTSGSDLTALLNALANRKSDKEVVIVHNMELNGGLSTHIELTNTTIDFRHVGEQRILSWQQFEECVSKYHSFFEKEIILLSDKDAELASRYNIKCVNRGTRVLTHDDIESLPKLSIKDLENLMMSLSKEDKKFLCSYWLGKSYERVPEFYDRYKMELLNRLTGEGIFDNILVLMNGDVIRAVESQQ